MAKEKIDLNGAPTFKSVVSIPRPGMRPADVEFIFKGRDKDEFKEWLNGLKDREDVDAILDVASGWELSDPFDRDSVTKLVKKYLASPRAVIEKYISEVTGARLGNL